MFPPRPPPLRLCVRPLVHPLKVPLVTARGPHTVRAGWLLRLTDADGGTGHGEALPLADFGTESHASAEASLRGVMRSLDRSTLPLPELPEHLEGWLAPFSPTLTIRHALELAALELQAVRAGVPLSEWLLGAWQRMSGEGAALVAAPAIEVNAILGAQDVETLAGQGLAAKDLGARTVKVKVASGPLVTDVRRLQRLREVIGDAMKIRIDVNGGWRDRHQTREAIGALSSVSALEVCEQPLPVGHVEGLRALRGTVPCLLAADESLVSQAEHVIGLRAVDVLVLKPMVLGGVLPAMRWAHEGRRVGLRSLVTGSLDGVVARAGAAHLASVIGSEGLAHGLWTGPLFANEPEHPYVPDEGRIVLPSAPGLGLDGQSLRGGAA